jgi:hypothetical protein
MAVRSGQAATGLAGTGVPQYTVLRPQGKGTMAMTEFRKGDRVAFCPTDWGWNPSVEELRDLEEKHGGKWPGYPVGAERHGTVAGTSDDGSCPPGTILVTDDNDGMEYEPRLRHVRKLS